MTEPLKANPFQYASFWYWVDENNIHRGPYASQTMALLDLLRHVHPPWYVRLWRKVKEFYHDTGQGEAL